MREIKFRAMNNTNDRPSDCYECKHYDSDIMKLPCSECERINTLYDNYESKDVES